MPAVCDPITYPGYHSRPPLSKVLPESGIVFSRIDLFTHEQYFWPFYVNYIPDHFQRLDAALRWVTEHGYKRMFYHEGFLAGPV